MTDTDLAIDDKSTIETEVVIDPIAKDDEGEEQLENTIVLATDESEGEPKPKPSNEHFVLKRFEKKNTKLVDENAALKQQLEQAASKQAPMQLLTPDEYDFTDRQEYLKAKTTYDFALQSQVADARENKARQGHHVEAQEQQRNESLNKYSEAAKGLKVSDFNETQDRAFDVLGDEFAQVIATQVSPKDAAKLMYWFGKNPKAAAEHKDMFMANPGQSTYSLGKLAGKLTIKPKQSDAAEPEGKIDSGSVGGLNEDWQSQYDKILDSATEDTVGKTMKELRALKARARESGFTAFQTKG